MVENLRKHRSQEFLQLFSDPYSDRFSKRKRALLTFSHEIWFGTKVWLRFCLCSWKQQPHLQGKQIRQRGRCNGKNRQRRREGMTRMKGNELFTCFPIDWYRRSATYRFRQTGLIYAIMHNMQDIVVCVHFLGLGKHLVVGVYEYALRSFKVVTRFC